MMTTPEWEGFKTKGEVSVPGEAPRPSFGRKNYDSRGHEKKDPVKEEEKKQNEGSFLSKYWFQILIAFMIIPRFLGGG